MKLDREYIFGIVAIVIGVPSLFFAVISYLSARIVELSTNISDALSLLPTCHFDPEKTKRIGDILLSAKEKLVIEGNYPDASSLFASVKSDMWSCKPLLEANPWYMLFTVLILMILFGVMIIIRHYRTTHSSTKPSTL